MDSFFGCACVGRVWDYIRVARLPGGGESRDIWKLGPLSIKRWTPNVSPDEIRDRCRVSRAVPVCNSMWYIRWFHWTIARWVQGEPATHAACNATIAAYPVLSDLHSENVLNTPRGPVVIDFARRSPARV
jgi:hypothetical protein